MESFVLHRRGYKTSTTDDTAVLVLKGKIMPYIFREVP